jgi:hypothetical protein
VTTESTPEPPRLPAACLTSTVVGLLCVAGVALADMAPSAVVLTLGAAFLPYGCLLAAPSVPRRAGLWAALGGAALAGLALVLAPAALSDDLYRYLWDARVLASGVDPYRYAPDDAALAHLRDGLWQRINNPQIPTIYPPVAQLLFSAAGGVAHEPWSVKALALLAHLAVIPVVFRLAPRERAGWAALAYGLNPLALSESALNGHVDVVAGLAVAATVLALLSRRPVAAALMLALATGTKLVGFALLPLLAGRRRAMALAALLSLAMLAPLVLAGAGSQTTGGLGQYARRWRGNDGPFVLLEASTALVVGGIARVTGSPPGRVRVPILRGALEATRGTPLDPRASLVGEKKEVADLVEFDVSTVSELASRAIVVLGVLLLALGLTKAGASPLITARWVLLCGLLFAPQVHPWYLLWLLPLEAATGRFAGLCWSATVLVAYAPLDAWAASRTWSEPALGRFFEYAVVFAVLAYEARTQGFRAAGVDPLRAHNATLHGR